MTANPKPGDGAVYYDDDSEPREAIITRETLIGHYDLVFTLGDGFEKGSIRFAYNIPIEADALDPDCRCFEHHPDAEWAGEIHS